METSTRDDCIGLHRVAFMYGTLIEVQKTYLLVDKKTKLHDCRFIDKFHDIYTITEVLINMLMKN